MAAVLYHYITDDDLRKTIKKEHETMAALFKDYIDALHEAYEDEIGVSRE